MTRGDSRERGFTLMEVMLAVFIFSFISLTVYGVLTRAIEARQVGEERAELYAQGREVLLKIASDIEGALLPESGDRIFFEGEASRVAFIAMNRGGYGLNRVRPGLVLIEYILDNPGPQGFTPLIRVEQDFQHMLDEADGIERDVEESDFDLDESNDVQAPVIQEQVFLQCPPGAELSNLPGACARVGGLQFRFYDDAVGEWSDFWDSFEAESMSAERIPDAVEIVLVMLDEDGGEHEFYTVVDLPLSRASTKTPGVEGTAQDEEEEDEP